ncbi:spore killer candidate 1 [Fusarium coicis]|nr:spore killer candidate 1 [Fusarium coicis]
MNKTTARTASDTLHFKPQTMPGTILPVSKKEFEEILDEKLQPIKDILDVIKKRLDDLTNQDLAPKTPPKETDIRPQD